MVRKWGTDLPMSAKLTRYRIEWECPAFVDPMLGGKYGGERLEFPHKINNEPGVVNTGGWLHVMAKSEADAIKSYRRVLSKRYTKLIAVPA